MEGGKKKNEQCNVNGDGQGWWLYIHAGACLREAVGDGIYGRKERRKVVPCGTRSKKIIAIGKTFPVDGWALVVVREGFHTTMSVM